MAQGLLDGIMNWLSQPGQAQALGALSARLMAGGAPSTDPGASQRAWGAGAADYAGTLSEARQAQELADMRKEKARREEAEYRSKIAGETAARKLLTGTSAATGSVRSAEEAGIPGHEGALASLPPEQRSWLEGIAASDPLAAAKLGFAQTTKEDSPFTLTEGQVRYNRKGEVIAKGPEEQKYGAPILDPETKLYYQVNPKSLKREYLPAGVAAQSSTRYQSTGPYTDPEGNYLGEGVFDRQSGKMQLRLGDALQEMPSGAKPITEGGLAKNTFSGPDFLKLAKTAADEERSMRSLERYVGNLKDTDQGFSILADKLAGHFKTLFGKELTPQEYQTLLQNGQLQGLLGGFRTEVVGPGVMTEYDAARVLAALGGDVSLLRNKEVATTLMRDIFTEKVREYNEVTVPTYNAQIKATPRGKFTAKEPIAIDPNMFKPTAAPGTPDKDGWITLPNGVRVREKR